MFRIFIGATEVGAAETDEAAVDEAQRIANVVRKPVWINEVGQRRTITVKPED